jgi:hypothetical protein
MDNYFTEIEEHFLKRRGGSSLLLSSRDWALPEKWKREGVPLRAVIQGIDAAFDQRSATKSKINSPAYCSQFVLAAMANPTEN